MVESLKLSVRRLREENDSLHERLASVGIAPFGSFSTARSKWRCGDCAIDADIASFGHAVLELEVMCDDEASVPAAEREIELQGMSSDSAQLLGGV